MKRSTANFYRCPASNDKLALTAGQLNGEEVLRGTLTAQGRSYEITDGVPNFIYPKQLLEDDADVLRKYDEAADKYEVGLDWLFGSFFEDEVAVRNQMIDLLGLQPNSRVLEVGCGTGRDSALIADRLSSSGSLFLQELSSGMMNICRKSLSQKKVPIEFSLANAAYLPFADQSFDAVYHFGGINTFSEKQRAFSEMTRVAKKGGVVVIGDESVPPWLREKDFGKILMKANPLYEHRVPLECIPESARNVSVKWVLGNAFYVIRYEVGDGPPPVDLDRPIPGKGDSLRSRYYGNTAVRS